MLIRKLLKILNEEQECVWSGKELKGNNYDVNHILPYSIWVNNDYGICYQQTEE